MQLCRTLFIPSNQNRITRKVVEVLLSFWIEKQFSKNEILNFYLTSVRFETGVNGVISASKYFFPNKIDKKFSNEEAFFLVERLSNITSSYRKSRIKNISNRITMKNLLVNWEELLEIYNRQVIEGRIIDNSIT